MIQWTEEDVKFILENMIMPAIKEKTKNDLDMFCLEEEFQKGINMIVDALHNQIVELNFNQQRDTMFFKNFLKLLSPDIDIDTMYDKYCKDFEELNGHLRKEGDFDVLCEGPKDKTDNSSGSR